MAVNVDEGRSDAADKHEEQSAYWNGSGGAKWVAAQDRTDAMLVPVSRILFDRAEIAPGSRIVDIGCGCGATTLELSGVAGPEGHVLGVDISKPMLARARERSRNVQNVSFLEADASVYKFSATTDVIVSRFGVMFFGEPVSAFSNMRGALIQDGRITFACWRPFEENAWMKVPLDAAYRHVPRLPRPGPEDPGPYSFADPEKVRRILTEAGYRHVTLEPVDLSLDVSAGGSLDAAVEQATMIGAASRAIQEQPSHLRDAAVDEIRNALAPFVVANEVRLAAAIWIVSASR